jgi:ribosome-binding factor A
VSITRVEVADDFTRAKVYFSAMGTEAEQRNVMRALRHASGRIQELMMKQISLRFTPVLEFVPDVQFKKSLTTLALIQQAMQELREREEAENPEASEESEDQEDSPKPDEVQGDS